MADVYLSLGSNIEPETNLVEAVRRLGGYGDIKAVSSAWETMPIGTDGPNFLNAAVHFCCEADCERLKENVLRKIEDEMGRVRTADKFAPRTIDVDIIILDEAVYDPRLWSLAYLAVPLAEINAGFCNPETGETLGEVSQRLRRVNRLIPRADVRLR